MPFTFTPCTAGSGAVFEGLYEIQPRVFSDNRGYFFECYSEKDFAAAGLTMKFVQDNQSKSARGVLRGLHFQKKHPQGKLVRAVAGSVYDVAVDIRCGSPTFGQYYGVILSSEKQNQFYIPEGFAHGFFVLSDAAVFTYKCTDFYHPEDEAGLMWNDENIGIDWSGVSPEIIPLLSEKDAKHPAFSRQGKYFDIHGHWIGD
ncbi:MAG: dTDP-4-dehydrorhamnose 3,5-epimerase [Bacteroides sp.]|nr:dTDP-4-dehydrorhamnose 3,5-epimerase [Prevotella sp.]MCM1407878.1 dTDP-4-dehydrorhamnose 3,5-epimerase [Treponema brennaborense]MCM1469620.1 dTDP-4-dehydrorhamnose 3,5-epimerase [Bacteroides sp.]